MTAISRRARALFGLFSALWLLPLAGCSTQLAGGGAGSRYLVSSAKSQFFKYGPAQSYGADATLPKGLKVTMVTREFGFSQIRLDDGTTGYVATEDLTPAPPDPKPAAPTLASRHRSPAMAPVRERPLDLTDVPIPALPE